MNSVFRIASVFLGAGCLSMTALADEIAGHTKVLSSSGVNVTVEDIDRYIRATLPADERARLQILSRPGIYEEMANNLYTIRSIAAEARTSPNFDREQAQWTSRLLHQRQIMKDYRSEYINQQLKDVNWESTAREHYLAHPETYRRPERIKASHILIRSGERSEEEAQALAEELYQQLADGADFAELAKEYSEDGSADYGGTLGTFARGKMVPEFEAVAFALAEPGDYSEPVKTTFGYHLILLQGRTPAQVIPFEDVRDDIVEDLQVKMGDAVWQRKLVRLRSRPDVQLDEELLTRLRKAQGVRASPGQQ
jgi:peptidyl-prolyl cis-trans isomerase C